MHDARHPGPAAGRRNALMLLGAAGVIATSGRSPAQGHDATFGIGLVMT